MYFSSAVSFWLFPVNILFSSSRYKFSLHFALRFSDRFNSVKVSFSKFTLILWSSGESVANEGE